MVTFVVTYPTTSGATFDADYYLGTHMPLVDRHFGPHGMSGARVLLPEKDDAAYAAITMIDFPDMDALRAALGSPEGAEVSADVANFSSITPVTMVARTA